MSLQRSMRERLETANDPFRRVRIVRRQEDPVSFDPAATVAQFDEAIDVLERALRECSHDLWEKPAWQVHKTDPWMWPAPGVEPIPERTERSIQSCAAVWAVAYHCLWFLDFYSTVDMYSYESPEYVRGGPEEQGMAADGAAPIPTPVYSREVLLRLLDHGRAKVKRVLPTLTDAELAAPLPVHHPHHGKTFEQLLGVNLAHVREHGGDLLAFIHRPPSG